MLEISDFIIANTHENINHETKLNDWARNASQIEIVCPFISVEGTKWLIDNKKPGIPVVVIAELSARGVISGVQSVAAIERLLNSGVEVRYLTSQLHAKVYIFNGTDALITSANMTGNGLRRNFEIGFSINRQIINERSFKGGHQADTDRIRALWDFLKKQSEPVTTDVLDTFRRIEADSESLKVELERLENEFTEKISDLQFVPFQRSSSNPQNVTNDLRSTNLFGGFKVSDWDIFDHTRELNQDNLNQFRKDLNERVNPLLNSFYLQLRNEPMFKNGFGSLDKGFSANLQLKQRFPHNRYMYLTKQRQGKTARKHIGEATIIIGFGKDPNTSRKWLEVRSGVEEEVLNKLSDAGRTYISALLAHAKESSEKLRLLGDGWHLAHDIEENFKSIAVSELTADRLRSEIAPYLETNAVSDLQIRRKYFLDNEGDKEILLSPRITSVIAQDIENLAYFFELANGAV